MKAFDKYYQDSDDSVCTKCGAGFIPARDVWRKALEWTLKTEKELEEQDAPIGMREVIEQELEIES